jgi:hypothetical protein
VTTEEQKCVAAGIDPESVECPTCGAFVGWGCNETHAGRYGGGHFNPHPARSRAARLAKPQASVCFVSVNVEVDGDNVTDTMHDLGRLLGGLVGR